MPWLDDVKAVLECYLGGEGIGRAQADLLYGKAFGHGLSYTNFRYGDLLLCHDEKDAQTLHVSVTVSNIGTCAGKEVVQLYVAPPEACVERPIRELKGFEKIFLEPGESKKVDFTLDRRAFAAWDDVLHQWRVEGGAYRIELGKSSMNIVLAQSVVIAPDSVQKQEITRDTAIGDLSDEQIDLVMTSFGKSKEEKEHCLPVDFFRIYKKLH